MGQELELAAREMPLGVPEHAVLGGELLGQLGLEPVELAAELAILVQGRPELAPGFLHLAGHLLKIGPGLLPRTLDLGLGRGDQLFRVGLRFQRGLELRQLSHQILQQMLIGIGLLERPQACGPNRPQPLDGLPGAQAPPTETARPPAASRLQSSALVSSLRPAGLAPQAAPGLGS